MHNLQSSDPKFFTGIVLSSDAVTYVVTVTPDAPNRSPVLQGLPLGSSMAQLFGFKECLLPQPGSRVFCYSTGFAECLVLGIIPKPDAVVSYPQRAVVGAGDGGYDEQNRQGYIGKRAKAFLLNNNRPTDVVQGEHVLVNDFGVMLGMFQQLAILKGSDLAQVQVHLLDDLVRIISHNFEHFHSMGGSDIKHDGKNLQLEFGLTHDPKEALGQPQVSATSGQTGVVHTGKTTTDDADVFHKLAKENQVAIERLKGFVGSISNLVNLLLVRPSGELQALAGDTTGRPDRGLASLQLGLDGRVHLASAAGVSIEKTNWIRVPRRVRSPEDPEGDDAAVLTKTKTEPFKFDDSYSHKGQPYLYFLQIRDYLSYFFDGAALAGFKDLPKDFAVNDDITKEHLLGKGTELHPDSKSDFLPRTAGCYVMPNGGVMLRDAWGSALVMEGGNIYLQPAKDLMVQPMRHLVAKVGGSLSLNSQKDVEISSSSGAVRMKAQRVMHLYSDRSGIILHSNAPGPYEYLPVDGKEAVMDLGGILLTAPKAGVFSYAPLLYLQGTQQCLLRSDSILALESGSLLTAKSAGALALFSDASLTLSSVSSTQLISDGQLLAFGQTGTIIGLEEQTMAVASFGLGKLPVQGLLTRELAADVDASLESFADNHLSDYLPIFKDNIALEALAFRFPSSANYGLSPKTDVVPQTLAQQEEQAFPQGTLVPWQETEVNGTYPFPGADFSDCYITAGLKNLARTNGDLHNIASGHVRSCELSGPQNLFKNYKAHA